MNLPLHPIVVHFPIALAVLVPLLALGVLFALARCQWPEKAWHLVLAAQALLFVSSIVAMKSGEKDEGKVGKYVQAKNLHDHEEWGEKMPIVTGAVLVLCALPLFLPRRRKLLLNIAVAASVLGAIPAILTGHSGGKLVYQDGATDAHRAIPTINELLQGLDSGHE